MAMEILILTVKMNGNIMIAIISNNIKCSLHFYIYIYIGQQTTPLPTKMAMEIRILTVNMNGNIMIAIFWGGLVR
eukprot:scaffold110141_cov52-Cyclotella_meneghiniana.AAC.3